MPIYGNVTAALQKMSVIATSYANRMEIFHNVHSQHSVCVCLQAVL